MLKAIRPSSSVFLVDLFVCWWFIGKTKSVYLCCQTRLSLVFDQFGASALFNLQQSLYRFIQLSVPHTLQGGADAWTLTHCLCLLLCLPQHRDTLVLNVHEVDKVTDEYLLQMEGTEFIVSCQIVNSGYLARCDVTKQAKVKCCLTSSCTSSSRNYLKLANLDLNQERSDQQHWYECGQTFDAIFLWHIWSVTE